MVPRIVIKVCDYQSNLSMKYLQLLQASHVSILIKNTQRYTLLKLSKGFRKFNEKLCIGLLGLSLHDLKSLVFRKIWKEN